MGVTNYTVEQISREWLSAFKDAVAAYRERTAVMKDKQ